MTGDRHSHRSIHIHVDIPDPYHRHCLQILHSNNKLQLHYVRGIQHLVHMAMDYMVLHLVHD